MKTLLSIIVIIGIFIGVAWGSTMLAKWLSYKFFYEAQVKDTIHQVLREEGLIGVIKEIK